MSEWIGALREQAGRARADSLGASWGARGVLSAGWGAERRGTPRKESYE